MVPSLKNHPFPVEAFFEHSLVLTFAVPKEALQLMIPECLSLDTYDGKWAFIAVAMVQTKDLRPKGFPKLLGNDFFLIGYRIFIRYTTNSGKQLRGLYILKSETNKRKMEILGNIFTKYQYTTTDIQIDKKTNQTNICSHKSNFDLVVETGNKETKLPESSPFSDLKEVRRFAGPLPFTFSYNSITKKVLIIEGVRQRWIPQPIKVVSHHFSFLKSLNLPEVQLANAFVINNIPYHWKKGKLETWKG